MSTNPLVLTWDQAFAAGPAVCGGKGWNLGRLARYGFRVPRGGVLAAAAHAAFMEQAPLAGAVAAVGAVTADEAASPAVAARLDDLRRAIETAPVPDDVASAVAAFLDAPFVDGTGLASAPLAVRSSAVAEDGAAASFAGIHRSILHVRGTAAVLDAIRACWASLWTPQALVYRRKMRVPDAAVRCAVVLCEMVRAAGSTEPAAAGVAFSACPRTGRRDLVVIDAARGIGEKVVSGAVDPAHTEMRLEKMRPVAESRRGAAVLTPEQEAELALHVARIHWALGDGDDAQDVEWAHDGERFWFVQSRPVTRLPHATWDVARGQPVIWSTANIKDAVPGIVATLSWSLIVEVVYKALYGAIDAAGVTVPPGMRVLRRHLGRGYFDVTGMQWVWWDLAGAPPETTTAAIGGHHPHIEVPAGDPMKGPAGKRRKQIVLRMFKSVWSAPKRLPAQIDAHFAAVRAIERSPWGSMSAADLLGAIDRIDAANGAFETPFAIASQVGSAWGTVLVEQLKKVAGDRAQGLAARLLAGGGGMPSAEQGWRVLDLAEAARGDAAARAWLASGAPAATWRGLPAASPFRAAMERFLADFGHRAVYEADMSEPRWSEDPSYVVEQVRRHLDAPAATTTRGGAASVRDAARAELRRVTFWRRPLITFLARRAQQGYALREAAKSALSAAMCPMRLLALETGRRLVAAGHLARPEQAFDLAKVDLVAYLKGAWDGRGAAALADDRAARRAAWLREDAPECFVEDADAGFRLHTAAGGVSAGGGTASAAAGDRGWTGIPVAGGRATGTARVLRHPSDGARLAHGEILVAPSTDPGWTPLFLRASAVVLETGGFLSHGAIVAREFGLPAVANLPGIVAAVRDGESLTVDGDAGTVLRTR